MSTPSVRIGKLEKTVRAKGREDFIASVEADFATALNRVASNDPVRTQLQLVQKDFIRAGAKKAEEEALERFLAEKSPDPAPPTLISIDALYNPVTVKIAANGKRLPDTATDHVAVLLPQFDMLYTVGKEIAENWKQAVDMGSKVDLFDGKGEWQLWDDVEAHLTIDRSKSAPAVLSAFADHTPTDLIYWTRRPLASSPSDHAIYVSMNYGYVNWSYQLSRGRVRACRRVRASQF